MNSRDMIKMLWFVECSGLYAEIISPIVRNEGTQV